MKAIEQWGSNSLHLNCMASIPWNHVAFKLTPGWENSWCKNMYINKYSNKISAVESESSTPLITNLAIRHEPGPVPFTSHPQPILGLPSYTLPTSFSPKLFIQSSYIINPSQPHIHTQLRFMLCTILNFNSLRSNYFFRALCFQNACKYFPST
jgi:hypothetical protein